jgi:hypothetical protein
MKKYIHPEKLSFENEDKRKLFLENKDKEFTGRSCKKYKGVPSAR